MAEHPAWASVLDDDDWQFLRRFLLSSGSLKELAREYDISYPTIRQRLDRLIAKVRAAEEPAPQDAFHRMLRAYVAEGRLPRETAKTLLAAHRKSLKECGVPEESK